MEEDGQTLMDNFYTGSRVEEKRSSLVWHHRGYDPDYEMEISRIISRIIGSCTKFTNYYS